MKGPVVKTCNSLDLSEAQRIVQSIQTTAKIDGGKPVSIAVVDAHGDLLAFAHMDGTKGPSRPVAIAKARTAVEFGRDTMGFCHLVDPDDTRVWIDNPEGWDGRDHHNAISNHPGGRVMTWGGGTVVIVDKEVVGGVGVSNRTEAEDHALASIRP